MSITLNTLKPQAGSTKRSSRVGRGNASGHGAYSGRGIKGQRARSGGRRHGRKRGLKQMLLQLPKHRGFQSQFDKAAVVNVGKLNIFPAGAKVTPELMRKHGFIKDTAFVKVLGEGKLAHNIIVHANAFSASAKAAIEKAGGSITILSRPQQPLPKRQREKREAKQ